MAHEIKYTTDGRKVAVLGKLNAAESIVQEIFVVGEAEIPSGENFVVKSLHDAPAVSWKEKNLKELEERYDKTKTILENQTKDLEKKLYAINDTLKKKIEWAAERIKDISPESFTAIENLLLGKYNYIVEKGYSEYTIIPFNKAIVDLDSVYWGSGRVDNLKMLTVFGRADKGLTYKLNRYSDGSGSDTEVLLFATLEEAKAFISDWINKQGELTHYKIKQAIQHNIHIDDELLKEYHAGRLQQAEKVLAEKEKNVADQKRLIKEIKTGGVENTIQSCSSKK